MAKKDKKSMFSAALQRAIATEIPTDGSTIKVETIAKRLMRKRLFPETNSQLFSVAVSRALHNGEVTGYSAKRGRNGGAYHVASFEALQAAE